MKNKLVLSLAVLISYSACNLTTPIAFAVGENKPKQPEVIEKVETATTDSSDRPESEIIVEDKETASSEVETTQTEEKLETTTESLESLSTEIIKTVETATVEKLVPYHLRGWVTFFQPEFPHSQITDDSARPVLAYLDEWWLHISHVAIRHFYVSSISQKLNENPIGYNVGDKVEISFSGNDEFDDSSYFNKKSSSLSTGGLGEVRAIVFNGSGTVPNPEQGFWINNPSRFTSAVRTMGGANGSYYNRLLGLQTFQKATTPDGVFEIKNSRPNATDAIYIEITRLISKESTANTFNDLKLSYEFKHQNLSLVDGKWEFKNYEAGDGFFNPSINFNKAKPPALLVDPINGLTVEQFTEFKGNPLDYITVKQQMNLGKITAKFKTLPDTSIASQQVVTIEVTDTLGEFVHTTDVNVVIDVVSTSKPVTVKYQDAAGKQLAEEIVLNGIAGEEKEVTAKTIKNYHIPKGNPTSQVIIFTDKPQTVIFVYEADKTTIEVKDVAIAIDDPWEIADNFIGATNKYGEKVLLEDVTVAHNVIVDEPGEYEVTFTLDGLIKVAKVHVAEGELLLTVPTIGRFNEVQLSEEQQLIHRQGDWGIKIQDTRKGSQENSWRLMASVLDSGQEMDSYYAFVNELGEVASLTTEQLIYQKNPSQRATTTEINWADHQGILLSIPETNHLQPGIEYASTILWNLVEGP